MGVKRVKGKRRGIQRGVQKHKVGPKIDLYEYENAEHRRVFGIKASEISVIAEDRFHSICCWCWILHVLPAEYICGEIVVRKNWKRMACHCHYILIAAQVTNAIHKMLTLGPLLFRTGVTVDTLMSLVLAFPSICAFTLGTGSVLKVGETAQLLNALKYITFMHDGGYRKRLFSLPVRAHVIETNRCLHFSGARPLSAAPAHSHPTQHSSQHAQRWISQVLIRTKRACAFGAASLLRAVGTVFEYLLGTKRSSGRKHFYCVH